MKIIILSTACFFFSLSLCRVSSQRAPKKSEQASLPPRGWNSYDSFSWTIAEQEFLQTADIVSKRLHPHGYEYVVVDFLWYRKKVKGASADSFGFDIIDEWGRMVPDPDRWPSSKGGKGFTEVAKKVHNMGLKFGIHVMKGLSTQAFNANTPILDVFKGGAFVDASGKQWRAKDIGLQDKACKWMPHGFMSINTTLEAGKAFLRSLYKQYGEWGVDFVKLDCIFGDDLDKNEIRYVSELIKGFDHPTLFSLSPGVNATPAMAKEISELTNVYRITGDDWDTWPDVAAHFNVSRDFAAANMIGAKGLKGKSWPDLDMLPLGWLTDPASSEGPHRHCKLTLDEQKTQVTLWAMAKSPLMFGGDVRKLDNITYNLITNPAVLEINHFSSNNKEFPHILGMVANSTITTNSSGNTSSETTSVLGLASCKDPTARGWSTAAVDQNQGQVCWQGNPGNKSHNPLCLYNRKPPILTNEEKISEYHYLLGKVKASEGPEQCLDASPKRTQASKYSKRSSVSNCRRDAHQMWELKLGGALINSYSGLCAVVDYVEAHGDTIGIRSWIATGRKGEIYVAFFNLNTVKMVISTKIADLAKSLPGKNMNGASCKCREVWSGKDFGVLKDSIGTDVETHGTALFILNC